MYRYERPQKGRNREFFQFSAEVFGIESMTAELEVFQIIETIINKYKIDDSWLEINSLGSEEDQKNFSKALQDFLKPLKSKLDKDSQNRLEKNPLRIGVKNGGCSGFSYILDFEEKQITDTIYSMDGFDLIIDPLHLEHINNLEVDFQQDLNNRGFIYNNPNAETTCGCGTSFSPK